MEPNTPTSVILWGAFLGGSGLGVIITKVVDIIQVKRQHKLDLQKMFFQKKLEVLEKTVVFWTNVQSMIQGLEMTLKSVMNPGHYYEEKITEDILGSITKEYYDINNESKVLASSLRLYTDVPPEYYFSYLIVEYFNAYGELGLLIESGNTNEITEQQFKEAADKQTKKMNELSNRINKKSTDLINLLRMDLKRFDN